MEKNKLIIISLAVGLFGLLYIGKEGAVAQEQLVYGGASPTELSLTPVPVPTKPLPENSGFDPLTYTLGPDDVVEITVMRHPEFSGLYSINLEGKLQYKFVGDLDVNGMTKKELEDKIKVVLASYLLSPEVNVTVTEFRSKFIIVLGEVGRPGKYFIRSEKISVKDAAVAAGLPTETAAKRRCSLITPSHKGGKTKPVDLYAVLYLGNLKKNIDMYPGDILYVPSTVMAKVIRVINPVASTIGLASSSSSGTSTTKDAVTTFAR